MVYGNGWFEYVCMGNKDPMQPLSGKLYDIQYINPSMITGYKLNKDKTDVEYWKYRNGAKTIWIHVSRIGHIGFYYDGDDPFSMSPLEVANLSIKADNDATAALGSNLVLFGHPFPVIKTTDNVNKKQVDDAYKLLEQMKKKNLEIGFAGFKDTTFDLLNPDHPSPKDALYHFYIHLAAAMDMPMMFLIGEQTGQLSGNEVELNDYYKSISAQQEIYLSPIIHNILKLLLGESWRYEIYWNPLFVDEKTELENMTTIMKAVGEMYSLHGLIDVVEARQMLREHDINIPEDGMLDEPEPMNEPVQNEPDDAEEEQPENKPEIKVRRPTQDELAIARKQRELGEKLIREGAAK